MLSYVHDEDALRRRVARAAVGGPTPSGPQRRRRRAPGRSSATIAAAHAALYRALSVGGALRIGLVASAASRSASRSPAAWRRTPGARRGLVAPRPRRDRVRRARLGPRAAGRAAGRGRSRQRRGPRRRRADARRGGCRAPRLPRPDARARATGPTSTSCTTTPAPPAGRDGRRARAPVVTTLHTPPTPWLESAIRAGARGPGTFVGGQPAHRRGLGATSSTARSMHNGVDVERWRPGPAAAPAVWSGRLVPGEGAAPGDPGRRAAPACRSAGRTGPRRDWFDARGRAAAGPTVDATSATSTRRGWPPLVGAASVARRDPGVGRAVRPGRRRGAGLRHAGRRRSPAARCPSWSTTGAGVLVAPDDVDALADAIARPRARPRAVRAHAARRLLA